MKSEKDGLGLIKKMDEIRERLGDEELRVLEQELEMLNKIDIEFSKNPKINVLIENLKTNLIKAMKDMKDFMRMIKKEKVKYTDLELDLDYEVVEENILKDFTSEIKKAIKVIEKLDDYGDDVPLLESIVVNITEHIEKLRNLLEESADLLVNELKLTEEELGIDTEDAQQKRVKIFKAVLQKLKAPVKGEF